MSSRPSSDDLRPHDPLRRSIQQKPPTKDNTFRTRQKTTPMPITGYDAVAIEEYFDRRPLLVGWRLNALGIPLLGKAILNIDQFYDTI